MTQRPKVSVNYQIAIIGVLFFLFGFVTWLNGLLIPFFKQACELTDTAAYLVTTAFFIAYFVMAFPAGMILRKTGFPNGMALGLLIMSFGAAVFIPAALSRNYVFFLAGLFIEGTGLTLLQTASNPYITILGPIESAAQRISIMGICNKVAGMIGIFVLNKLLFTGMSKFSSSIQTLSGDAKETALQNLANKLIMPYAVIAIVLVLLALLIKFSGLPEVEEEKDTPVVEGIAEKTSIFQFPYLLLGVVAIFVYVGLEVTAIDTLSLYGQSFGIPAITANVFSIYALIALTFGYVVGIIAIPKMLNQQQALTICAILGILLTFGALFTSGMTSVWFLIALSFAHALMWPCIWPLSIVGLGKFTKIGSSLLIMGIAGGAIIPLIYGHLSGADGAHRHLSYWILLPCYVFLIYFALRGNRIGKDAALTNAQ
ncbi:MAG: glucose/galactose transporter [Bacteroidota bacterium]|nr:glucose/galactose transporter [Bacteroidota bacterium]